MTLVQPVTPALAGALRMMNEGFHVVACRVIYDEEGKKHFSMLPEGWAERGQSRDELMRAFAAGANSYMIACGPSGLVVADLDVNPLKDYNGIDEWFRSKRPRGGIIVKTPRGGEHHYFRDDTGGKVGNKQEIIPGVDVRGVGGGVIGPGSLENEYQLVEKGPLPPWSSTRLHMQMRKPKLHTLRQRSASGFFDAIPEGAARRDVENKLSDVAEHAATTWGTYRDWGGFRNTLIRSSFTLGGYVGGGFLSYETAYEALVEAIQMAGHEPNDDDLMWIEQGLEDGSREPLWVSRDKITVTHRPANRPFVLAPENTAELHLSEDFWEARKVLRHIRDTARLRGRGADGVLGAVLARMASLVPGGLRVDTGTGIPTVLNYYSILMGKSSGGKTTSRHIAEAMFPMGYDSDSPDFSLGSGQGIAAAYGSVVDDEFRQDRAKAFFYVDEGARMLALAKQKDSTLMATLRTAWTGSSIGEKNATRERDRRIRDYSLGLVVGLQPGQAAELLRDVYVDDGTLQRFVWFAADKHMVPEQRPKRIGTVRAMPWDLSAAYDQSTEFYVPERLKDEIYALDRDESRPEEEAHAPLLRVRTACLLAVLDNRREVTDEDWALAGAVMASSAAVMASVRRTVESRRKAAQEAYDARRIESEVKKVAALEAHEEKKIEELVLRVVERVRDEPGKARGALIRAIASIRYRDAADTAVERAIDRGLISAREGSRGGETLHPA